MNIFYLHENPNTAAIMHNDAHCIKMILETAQMLCTAHRQVDQFYYPNSDGEYVYRKLPDDKLGVLYKSAHVNHPSTIWVRSSLQHYQWTFKLFESLCIEYTYRYGKEHKTDRSLREVLRNPPMLIEDKGFTQPPQCMPDEYKTECSIQAYRNYYRGDKQWNSWRSKYTKRTKPTWM